MKLEDLNQHFDTLLGQTTESTNVNQMHIENVELDREINEQEIQKAISKQKNGKACWPDDISTDILKAAYDIISPQLVKLFNRVFNDAEYPENWT